MQRLLWFVNAPFPAVIEHLGLKSGPGGAWLSSLAHALQERGGYELHVAWTSNKVDQLIRFEKGGIIYYCLPSGNPLASWVRVPALRHVGRVAHALSEAFRTGYGRDVELALKVASQVNPALVHIHGSEEYYGLISSALACPVVLSVQGVLEACRREYWGRIPLGARFRMGPEAWFAYLVLLRRERLEREVIRRNGTFSCRTAMDEAFVRARSPGSRVVFDGGRVLRGAFTQAGWRLDRAEPKLIYTTMTPRPYKGTHDLIEAVGLLRSRLPGVHVRIAGPVSNSGYSGHLKRLVRRLGLEDAVKFLGQLSASEVDAELRKARTFVITSHIENSPNSLAEAQYVGTPCVASFAGGTVSMVQDGVNALCFPAGDAFLLSHALHRILTRDDLACALSARGSLDAGVRNNAAGLVERQVGIYRELCSPGASKELES